MTATLHPYPAYKPSCVPRLGDVPVHWDVRRLKDVGHLKAGAGFPHQYQGDVSHELPFFKVGDMGVSANARVMKEWQHTISAKAAKELGAHVFPSSTIVFAKVGAALLLNRRRMLVNPSCIDNNMMGFMPGGVDPDWMLYWLGTLDLGTIVNPGAVPSVNEGQMRVQTALVPPLPEQSAIVRYLDYVDRRIRRYVAAKRKLIALLEEEKQAVINRAVTRGLDPNVRLKPSGAEWLGDVPEHWEIPRLRNLGDALIGLTYDPQDVVNEEAGILVLRASNILDGTLVYGDNVFVRSAVPDKLVTREGDILICSRSGSRALIGKNARINAESAGTTFGAFMTVFRGANNDYLHLVFNSKFFEYQSAAFFTSTINQLTLGILYGMKVPFPPLEERQLILQYVEETTEPIIKAIAYTRRQIELVQEYRTRLIADVVTGKLDVREAAALLPDEADDEEPMDESGPLANSVAEDLYDPDKLAMESEVTV